MQNCKKSVQCKKLDFSLSPLQHGVIVKNLNPDLDINENMVKKELAIEPIESSTTVITEMKHEMEIKKENILENVSLNEIIPRSVEDNCTKLKDKSIIESALKSNDVHEFPQSTIPLRTKTLKTNIKDTLREKYKNLNIRKLLRMKSKLNNRSAKLKRQLQNASIDYSNVPVSNSSQNSSYVASCRFCKKSFNSVIDCNNHNCNQVTKDCKKAVHKCKFCPLVFKHKNYLDKHVKAHKRNYCRVCTAQFTTRRALCKHLKDVHNISEPLNVYKCNFCGKAFCKRPLLNSHLKNHAEGKLVCLKCGFMCTVEEDYADHMKKHKKPIKFECGLCNKQFVRKQQFNQHMMAHKQLLCYSCDVSFSTKKMLLQHQISYHGLKSVKKYECPTCKKSFIRPIHLKEHIRCHTGEKPVKCSHCNKNFSNKQSLAKHMKTAKHLQNANNGSKVELEKSFLCSTCGATFYRQQSLHRHIETIHKPGETLKCPLCNYNTKCKANLVRHMASHSNIKRYVCEICGASFRAFGTLKEHQAFVHSDSRNFVCDTCGKGFKNKSSLQRHLRIHREDRPYKCHCNRSYKRLSHLKRHLAAAHQMTLERGFDKKQLDPHDLSSNETSLEVQPNSTSPCNTVLNSQDQNLTLIAFHNSALQKNIDNIFPPLKNSDEENECKYVPCQNGINLLEKNVTGIDFDSAAKGTSMPISHSVLMSNSQDSVSLDNHNLNLSPSIYFNLTNFSTSPLKVYRDVPLVDVNRPRSLPNLDFQTSTTEAFFPFSMSNSDVPSSTPPAILLGRESPIPSDEQNSSSKQLFEDLSNFNSNSESGIVECSSDIFFNISKNSDVWSSSKDSNKMMSTFGNIDIPADNYEKMQSTISEFSGNLPSSFSPLLACNLVFPDDPLMECTIDTDSFNTEELF